MDISVIVPTFDRPLRIHRMLKSINEQITEARFEVIICDDGSGNSLTGIVESVATNYPCRVLWQNDIGNRCGKARNMGIRCAEGRIILFLDDDMVAPPNLIQTHFSLHKGTEELCILGEICSVPHSVWQASNAKAGFDWLAENANPDPRRATLENLDHTSTPWFYFATGHSSVSKFAVSEVGGFDEEFEGWGFEDVDFGLRLSNIGLKFSGLVGGPTIHLVGEDTATTGHRLSRSRLQEYLSNGARFVRKHGNSADARAMVVTDRIIRLTIDEFALTIQHTDFANYDRSVKEILRDIVACGINTTRQLQQNIRPSHSLFNQFEDDSTGQPEQSLRLAFDTVDKIRAMEIDFCDNSNSGPNFREIDKRLSLRLPYV